MDVNNIPSRGARVGCRGILNSTIQKSFAFTLTELMVSLSVASILFGVGIPSLQNIAATNRASSQINKLIGTIAFTRSEAIKRGQRITLCQSQDQLSCQTSDDWSQGWMVFTDDNNNRQLDNDEQLLTINNAVNTSTRINFNGAFGIDGYLVYKANGSVFPNGSFNICINHRPEYGKALILFRTGRLRVSNKTAQNQPINCS